MLVESEDQQVATKNKQMTLLVELGYTQTKGNMLVLKVSGSRKPGFELVLSKS